MGDPDKKTRVCPSCDGTGVNPEGILRPDGLLADCEICHGRGYVTSKEQGKAHGQPIPR